MNTAGIVTTTLCIMGVSIAVLVIFLVIAIRIVKENDRLAVYRFGRYIGTKGPGTVLLIPIVDRAVKLDAKLQSDESTNQAYTGMENIHPK